MEGERRCDRAHEHGGAVEVAASTTADQLCISVSDQGSGISKEADSHIFEPFFSTKSTSSRSGLGLGLSVSRSLIEGMGGTLTFQSRKDEGTVFRVVLPMRRQPKEESQDG